MKTSYKIEITMTEETETKVTKSFLIEEKPTGISENKYGDKQPVMEKKWETKEVFVVEVKESTLLSQRVGDLNLKAVIIAINNIGETK